MSSNLSTLPELARRFDVSFRKADYHIRENQIEPVRRVGNARMYDEAAAQRLQTVLEHVARREVRHAR